MPEITIIDPSQMTDELAISASSLSKIYPLYGSHRDRIKEALHPMRKKYHQDFYALRNINFEINKGETVGIIGQNGSGKSTLLKILSSVLSPTSGSFVINGKVSSLLELGTGFNPELTGIENVYFNGMLLGFTKEEMEAKLDDILSFADIGEFVGQPVKTYSSGMYVRLAFAVAVQVDPDILMVDEALSVGDARFHIKSIKKMSSFVEEGKTIIFVSHDTNAIQSLCDRVILLDKGNLIKDSNPSQAIDYYFHKVINEQNKENEDFLKPDIVKKEELNREGAHSKAGTYQTTSEIELLSCHIFNASNIRTESITSEEDIKLVCRIKTHIDMEEPHFGFQIRNRFGVSAFVTNTYNMGIHPKPIKRGESVTVEFAFNCNLFPELYSITIGASNKGHGRGAFENYYFLAQDPFPLKVKEKPDAIFYGGHYNMNPTFRLIMTEVTAQ